MQMDTLHNSWHQIRLCTLFLCLTVSCDLIDVHPYDGKIDGGEEYQCP